MWVVATVLFVIEIRSVDPLVLVTMMKQPLSLTSGDGETGKKVQRSPPFSVSSGLASLVRIHDARGAVFLGHRAGVVVHLRFRLGAAGDLGAVLAVAGDAGVGARFSGAAHDGGEVVVWERLSVLGGDRLVDWIFWVGWWGQFVGVGRRTGWLLGFVGQRDFVDGEVWGGECWWWRKNAESGSEINKV
jgi:hypothetical protein